MNFTKGMVYVNNLGASYGAGLKNLIDIVVNNIPELSIQTVTTNTTATYNVTLSYKGLLFSVRNSGDHKIYTKVGTVESYSQYLYPIDNKGTVTFMYSDEGVMNFSITPLSVDFNGSSWAVSIIPIEFKLSDNTTKELFWFRDAMLSDNKLGNIPQFIGSGSIIHSYLIDPDSQIQYSFSIAGADKYPVTQAKGKSVAVPATFTNSYGEVVSYNVKGSSPIYYIYPGIVDTLKILHPGTQIVQVGNVAYIGIGYEYFIRT